MLDPFLIAGIVKVARDVHKADKNNFEANKISTRASEKYYRSVEDENEANEKLKNTISRLATRKRAVLSVSFPRFEKTYSKIAKITIITDTEGIKELFQPSVINEYSKELDTILSINPLELSDNQLVSTFVFKGLTGVIVKESELNIASASARMKQARLYESAVMAKAESIDMMCTHINNVTDVLTKLNYLFLKSLKKADKIIDKNGYEGDKYSDEELVCIGACKELAQAVKVYIDVPIIDPSNRITEAAKEVVNMGKKYIEEFNKIVEGCY